MSDRRSPCNRVYVSGELVEITAHLVASYGSSDERHEGVAYWAGVPAGTVWVVTTVLSPEAFTTRGSYRTSAVANARVVNRVSELGLQVMAQIHGHPGDWVDHSPGDDDGAFMPYEGFYSLVPPRYGCERMLPLSKCGVHCYEHGRFVRLGPEEIEERFVVVPTFVDLRGGGG